MRYALPLALGLVAASAAPGLAYTQDDAKACTNDAFRLCGKAIPNRKRVMHCLYNKHKQLSPACYAVYQRYSHKAHRTAQTVEN